MIILEVFALILVQPRSWCGFQKVLRRNVLDGTVVLLGCLHVLTAAASLSTTCRAHGSHLYTLEILTDLID